MRGYRNCLMSIINGMLNKDKKSTDMEKIDSNNMWHNLSEEQQNAVMDMYFDLMGKYNECETDVIKGQLDMLEKLYGKENLERGYVNVFDFDEAINYVWDELEFRHSKDVYRGYYHRDGIEHVYELFNLIDNRGRMGDMEYLQIIRFIKANNLVKKLS